MKNFSIFIFCLLIGQAAFVVPVFAAEADPSRLPQVEPLMPAPQDISPNYKGNINSVLGGAPVSPSDNEKPQGQQGNFSSQGEENPDGSQTGFFASVVAGVKHHIFLFAFLLVLAVLLGYGLWKKGFNKTSEE